MRDVKSYADQCGGCGWALIPGRQHTAKLGQGCVMPSEGLRGDSGVRLCEKCMCVFDFHMDVYARFQCYYKITPISLFLHKFKHSLHLAGLWRAINEYHLKGLRWYLFKKKWYDLMMHSIAPVCSSRLANLIILAPRWFSGHHYCLRMMSNRRKAVIVQNVWPLSAIFNLNIKSFK